MYIYIHMYTGDGTLSSYGYMICLLHFLQTRPIPLLPNLQRLPPDWMGKIYIYIYIYVYMDEDMSVCITDIIAYLCLCVRICMQIFICICLCMYVYI
jgi:hypothetical protein